MAKENDTKTTATVQDATPEDATAPSVQVIAQYIKDLSLENPHSPASIVGGWGAPETSVQINIRTQTLQDGAYEVTLMFRIEAKNPKQDDKTAFIIELAYAGAVQIKNVPEDNLQPLLMVEIPKILFPFAREIVADSVVKGGFPPLYLQPVNFEAIYTQDLKRRQAESEQKSESA